VSWASEAHLSRACGYDHAAPLVLTQSEVIEGDEIAAFPAVLSTLPNLAGVHCQRGPVIDRSPPGIAVTARLGRRQQRLDPLPESVRHELLDHPDQAGPNDCGFPAATPTAFRNDL
jgi:hypothetical protein